MLEEENKKLSPLRDKKLESAASLQKLNLDMTNLVEEESRVKSLQEKLEKSIKTVESDLEREKSISLDADLNEKRISKEKEELLKTENELLKVVTSSSIELKKSKSNLENLQIQLDRILDKIEKDIGVIFRDHGKQTKSEYFILKEIGPRSNPFSSSSQISKKYVQN